MAVLAHRAEVRAKVTPPGPFLRGPNALGSRESASLGVFTAVGPSPSCDTHFPLSDS